jgi:hypothetical protein
LLISILSSTDAATVAAAAADDAATLEVLGLQLVSSLSLDGVVVVTAAATIAAATAGTVVTSLALSFLPQHDNDIDGNLNCNDIDDNDATNDGGNDNDKVRLICAPSTNTPMIKK